MDVEKAAQELTGQLEKKLRSRMTSVFKCYRMGMEELLAPIKWKPLVLVIGNYSSGKSTFINELLETPVQRTGQAPTDDCFTVLTMPEEGEAHSDVSGSTVVNDERLPFKSLQRFGENLIARLVMKKVDHPLLKNMAIIDTPGMLDSVTEKDRGYDYLGVVGEMARLADLVILMFDPHKAGTIKETYHAIRSTLPGATGEDRVVYVMNRIDECDNISDLVRSYGALCWNLSQMTGGKDMPRIFLTFAGSDAHEAGDGSSMSDAVLVWGGERRELKMAVQDAPRKRLNHILQEVDRGVQEVGMTARALQRFKEISGELLQGIAKVGIITSIVAFLGGDLLSGQLFGYPDKTMIGAVFSGTVEGTVFVLPVLCMSVVGAAFIMYAQRFAFPRLVKRVLLDMDSLVLLDTAYKKDLWQRVSPKVQALIEENPTRQLWPAHSRNIKKVERFLSRELSQMYARVQ